MPFRLNLLKPHTPRSASGSGSGSTLPSNPRVSISEAREEVDYDSSDSTDSTETAKSCFRSTTPEGRAAERAAATAAYVASSSSSSTSLAPGASYRGSSEFLLHPQHEPTGGRFSASSSAAPTPIPSRSGSPLPQFYSSAQSSSCTSDADSEPTSPLLARNRKNRWWSDEGRRGWWLNSRDGRRRRRRKGSWYSVRSIKRVIRIVLRHPLFPTQPTSIVSILVFYFSLLVLKRISIFFSLSIAFNASRSHHLRDFTYTSPNPRP